MLVHIMTDYLADHVEMINIIGWNIINLRSDDYIKDLARSESNW